MASAARDRDLVGFTVGITADRRWEEQARLFERRGARVLHAPTIRTLPLGGEQPLRRITEDLVARPPDVMIANTAVGIRGWFAAAESWGLGSRLEATLGRCRIYARGPKAAGAVHSFGLAVVGPPAGGRLADVVDMVIADLRQGERVALQFDGGQGEPSGTAAQVTRLRQAGAEVIGLPVYRWTLPENPEPALRLAEEVLAGHVHGVTFTAAPALTNWMQISQQRGLADELRTTLSRGRTIVGCVGPVCAGVARDWGLDSWALVEPSVPRLGQLVRAVGDRLLEGRISFELESVRLVLSGTTLSVDGLEIALSETEAGLLALLAAEPGRVVSKDRLLRTVWGAAGDRHTVEAGVARLRRRLGPLGSSVEAVHRRGYRLRAVSGGLPIGRNG